MILTVELVQEIQSVEGARQGSSVRQLVGVAHSIGLARCASFATPLTALRLLCSGMAGGNYFEVFNAGAYNATPNAKQGDLGTKVLKPRPSGTVWKRGSIQKTRWELTAAHGGGYTYRLCPSDATLDEECFSKTPLSLAKSTDGSYMHMVIMKDPKQNYEIPATVVEEGGGMGWIVHPMGAADQHPCDWNPAATGQHCDYTSCLKCGAPWYAADGACPCSCGVEQRGGISGGHFPHLEQNMNYGSSIQNLAKSNTIEDRVEVPMNIKPQDYVLQWRCKPSTTRGNLSQGTLCCTATY